MIMTLQEACDYAVTKIVEQGGKCTDKHGNCKYKNGTKHCAVGWLLDHDNADQMDYANDVIHMARNIPVPKLIADNVQAFAVLQRFHDSRLNTRLHLVALKRYIDTSAPQYQQWVDLH